MFFEDEEFSDKNCGTNEFSEDEVSDFNLDNDEWLVDEGALDSFRDYDAEEARVPEGVTEIESYAFLFMPELKTIYFPKTVKELWSDAIGGCDKLTKLVFENENVEFEKNAISCNSCLEEVYIGGEKKDVIYSKTEDNKLSLEKYLGDDYEFSIKDGTKAISSYAFANRKSLCELNIPDTVEMIDNNAFENCTNIKELRLPNTGVCCLRPYAFFGWTENQTIYAPRFLKGIKFFQKWRKGCRANVIYY
ncbi:MAG: leucine-rich repeat domain-containing protein [Clostridia bacterium]|nr:leucine-rich repeat domain-containing protein [Clostridia bacterium]